MNEDFSINLKTILDNSSIENVKKQLKELKDSIEKSLNINVKNSSSRSSNSTSTRRTNYSQDLKEANQELEKWKTNIAYIEERMKNDSSELSLVKWQEKLIEAKNHYNEVSQAIREMTNNQETISSSLSNQTQYSNQINTNVKERVINEEKVVKAVRETSKQQRNSKYDISNIFKGIKNVGLALVGIRGVYTSIRRAMSSYLSQNEELRNKLNACWYALGSLFAPALEFVINLFVRLVSYVDALVKALGFAGINMKNYGKAASNASKSLAGFDEINNLSTGSGGGVGSDIFGNFKIDDKFQDVLKVIETNAEQLKGFGIGAMFGIGVAALFTGHVGAGLGMIIGAGVLAYKTYKDNWNSIIQNVGGSSKLILSILGGFLAGLGLIFTLSGNLGIGLGLLVGGLGLTAISLDWDSMPRSVLETVSKISKIISLASTAIGLILLCIPGFQGAGAAMLVGGLGLAYGSYVLDTKFLANEIGISLDDAKRTVDSKMPDLTTSIKKPISDSANHIDEVMKNSFSVLDPNSVKGKGVINNANLMSGKIDSALNSANYGFDVELYLPSKKSISDVISGYGGTIPITITLPTVKYTNSGTPVIGSDKITYTEYGFGGHKDTSSVVVKGSGGGLNKRMAYALGTDYVPNDQIALLHKGEAVIPAEYNNGTQGSPYTGGETNSLLERLIDIVESKDFRAYISQSEIGQSAVRYINQQSRIRGGSLV